MIGKTNAQCTSGGGINLDPLKNPAAETDVLSDKEYYDDQGKKHTGNAKFSGTTLPRLNAPSISHSGSSLSISNPSSNGNFCNGYKLYKDNSLLTEQSSTSYTLTQLDNGNFDMFVRCKGNNFQDSPDSNSLNIGVFGVMYRLRNLTTTTTTAKLTNGQSLSLTIQPKEGFYLPEFISVSCNGAKVDFTYDSYTGNISIKALEVDYKKPAPDGSQLDPPSITMLSEKIEVSFVPLAEQYVLYSDDAEFLTEEVVNEGYFVVMIDAAAYEEPKLRTPSISLSYDELTIEDLKFAEEFVIYSDDEEIKTITIGA